MLSGLVSVTFRKLTPQEIVALCAKAGVAGIEWGGDIHVPHGDIKTAREVARMTRDAGLKVSSYGSYYRCDAPFEPILDTALALDAPIIRVWAGKLGSAETSPEERAEVVMRAREAMRLCREAGIIMAFEYHNNTLTDTLASTERLLEEVPYAMTYYQPSSSHTIEENAAELTKVSAKVPALHVYSWKGSERMPLSEGEALWSALLPRAVQAQWALLEFVRDDAPEQFVNDAQTLVAWLERGKA